MEKIYYIGYYSDPLNESTRKGAPSADTKMNYIVGCAKELGYEVEVISFCSHTNENVLFEKKSGYSVQHNGVKISFFTSYISKYRILRVLGRMAAWHSIKRYLREMCREQSRIIVYHSLALLTTSGYTGSWNSLDSKARNVFPRPERSFCYFLS